MGSSPSEYSRKPVGSGVSKGRAYIKILEESGVVAFSMK